MSKKHRVRTHHWTNGILETLDHFFDSLDEANLISGNVDAHTIKVYDPEGNLLDTKQSSAVPEETSSRSQPYGG
jgi:hypothetical protein